MMEMFRYYNKCSKCKLRLALIFFRTFTLNLLYFSQYGHRIHKVDLTDDFNSQTITSLCSLHGKIEIQINITVYTWKEKMKVYTAMVRKHRILDNCFVPEYFYRSCPSTWPTLSLLLDVFIVFMQALFKQHNNPHKFGISFCSKQVKIYCLIWRIKL